MVSAASTARLHALWDRPHTFYGWLTSVDHKDIGRRYIVTAFVFLAFGGIAALGMRTQLARPGLQVLDPEAYDQWFTMHGVTMIFWYASPILSGFGNFLIPLLLGARDMAYPRLNAFSYWTFLLSGVFLYSSLLVGQAPHAGWFAYVPYTNATYSPGLNMDFFALAILFLTISTTVGAINFIVTIAQLRPPGMTLSRMPLLMYSTLTVSWSIVFSLPSLSVACVMLELDRHWSTHFFDVAHGGSPLLWQQLFWFFGHPWVYVVFLPATGMISMLLPVFARRPIVGYSYVAASTVLTGVAGFVVWAHHMFAVGMAPMAMGFFSTASMVISVFSAIQVFAWSATLWHGFPVRTTSLWFALGFLVTFVIGGLNGIVTAFIPVDWQVHDTYFVVAHLHYVLIGANVFPVMAALYYWFPKMSGHLADERLGKLSFWLTFLGFNVAFLPMHVNGLLGMPRRIYTYGPDAGWSGLNMVETVGAYVMGLGLLVTFVNMWRAYRVGPAASENPWQADTLEWDVASPPPVYGCEVIPTVASLHPLWDSHDEHAGAGASRVLDHHRATLSTTMIDAQPFGAAIMPDDSLAPLVLAVAIAGLCVAVLLRNPWGAGVSTLASLLAAAWWTWPKPERLVPDAERAA